MGQTILVRLGGGMQEGKRGCLPRSPSDWVTCSEQLEQAPVAREKSQAVGMEGLLYLVPMETGHCVVVWLKRTLDGFLF